MTTEIKITNPNKVLFPKSKIKKIDLINYYIEISKRMMPFVENRLLAVIRCHKGNSKQECFFKKHPTTDKSMVEIFKDKREEYFYIKDEVQLIYQVQMGTIEFHPWGSSVKANEKPNVMIFDLDPDENLSLTILRSATKKVKSVLDELNLTSFLKTSGGKGYHIVVPFSKTKSWKQFYEFSRQVAILIEQKWPDIFTTNLKKDKRNNKIFIDYLRNNRGSTCVAPYSVRARENAPVSMPISWSNLNKVSPNEVTIKNYKKYLNNSWKNFFSINQELNFKI